MERDDEAIVRTFTVNGVAVERLVTVGKVEEYDEKGNKIYYKYPRDYEVWSEYDENGNCVHFKNSHGFENWREYDTRGKITHERCSDGKEYWCDYDGNGNPILYKDEAGNEGWWKYDEQDRLIYSSLEFETWHEYDAAGNEIHVKSSNGKEYWYEYWANGNFLKIRRRSPDGKEKLWEYNERGDRTHYLDARGDEVWDEYDEHGNHVHQKDSELGEKWWEYEFWPNGKTKRCVEYILVDGDETSRALYKHKFLEEGNETAGQARRPKGVQRKWDDGGEESCIHRNRRRI